MDILKLAKAGQTIYKLTQDDFYQIFSRLELTAAAEAIRKAYIAKDCEVAVRSAMTHLESAEAATLSQFRANNSFLGKTVDVTFSPDEARYKFFSLFYIYVVMAILYRLLGEEKLSLDAVYKLRKVHRNWDDFRSHSQVVGGGTVDALFSFLNPKNFPYKFRQDPIKEDELLEFLDIVAQEWETEERNTK